jgi:hypothetical protein
MRGESRPRRGPGPRACDVGRSWRSARSAASVLGHLELDEEGVRWCRPDQSPGFDVPWKDLERATVDARNFTVVLRRRDGGALLLGVLGGYGAPSGFVSRRRTGGPTRCGRATPQEARGPPPRDAVASAPAVGRPAGLRAGGTSSGSAEVPGESKQAPFTQAPPSHSASPVHDWRMHPWK